MKEKVLLGFLIMTIVSLMIYLAVSFTQWELNPAKWGEHTRSVSVMLCLLFYCFIPPIVISIKD